MDWTTPLRSQQADFIGRLKSGHLLHCDTQGQHSELTVISGKNLKQVRDFCWEMADKNKHKRKSPVRQVFLNNLKGKLGEEVIKLRLGELVTEVDYTIRIGGDGKVDFRLKSHPNIGIQVKARCGSSDSIRWQISPGEVDKNDALVCILIQEEVNEAQVEYNLVLAGFLPISLIKESGKRSFSINQLLYIGGLKSYLEKSISLKSDDLPHAISSKKPKKVEKFAKVNKSDAQIGRHEKLSKASGTLYPYVKQIKLANGNVRDYPRVAGSRNRDNIHHWYWAYCYEKKVNNEWCNRSLPVPKSKIDDVRMAINSNWSVSEIIALIKKRKKCS